MIEAATSGDVEKFRDLARRSYEAGHIYTLKSVMPFLSQIKDRDDLCIELAKESDAAGRFDEAEMFIEFMSPGDRGHKRNQICKELVEKHYEARRFDEVERFVKLMGRVDGHMLLATLADKCDLAGGFDEAVRLIAFMAPDLNRDLYCGTTIQRYYESGRRLDEMIKVMDLVTNKGILGSVLIKLVTETKVKHSLDEVVQIIHFLPPSYEITLREAAFVKTDVLADICFEACKLECTHAHSGMLLEEMAYQKYLEFIDSIAHFITKFQNIVKPTIRRILSHTTNASH